MLRKLASIPIRIIHRYVGPADKNTIEYWQRFIFYVISLSGTIAGTLAIVPAPRSYSPRANTWAERSSSPRTS